MVNVMRKCGNTWRWPANLDKIATSMPACCNRLAGYCSRFTFNNLSENDLVHMNYRIAGNVGRN